MSRESIRRCSDAGLASRCLWQLGGGLGGIALAHLLGRERLLAGTELRRGRGRSFNGGLHHPAKVRRVIQLFMNGGVSQMDTFDYKPELARRHGQTFDPGEHVEAADEHAGQADEVPVPVPAARRMRPVGQQRLPAPGAAASTTWRS